MLVTNQAYFTDSLSFTTKPKDSSAGHHPSPVDLAILSERLGTLQK